MGLLLKLLVFDLLVKIDVFDQFIILQTLAFCACSARFDSIFVCHKTIVLLIIVQRYKKIPIVNKKPPQIFIYGGIFPCMWSILP